VFADVRSETSTAIVALNVVREASMGSLSGKLLVASPALDDPNFARTVVLLVEHDKGGALGLVLNRPGAKHLEALWDETVHGPCPPDLSVMTGGPLEGPLLALHTDPVTGEREIVPGIYLAMRKDLLVALVRDAHPPLRIFIGYAGWGAGQLEAEVAAGDWTIAAATDEFVFGDTDSMWRRVVRHIADRQLAATLRIRHVPVKPWHN
jgi:putative transcriptional regulator